MRAVPAASLPPAPQPEVAKAATPEPGADRQRLGSDFRWPARGRVIAGFGANGGNEGINIAVPGARPSRPPRPAPSPMPAAK